MFPKNLEDSWEVNLEDAGWEWDDALTSSYSHHFDVKPAKDHFNEKIWTVYAMFAVLCHESSPN